jgi:predicted  nucleic acid-binding Zn-ribbon protein
VKADRDKLQLQLAELATVRADNERLNRELGEVRSQLTAANQKISERDSEIKQLESKIQNLESKPAEPEQQPTPAIKLPDAADTLKKIRKALGKKSTASLADVEKILEIIEGDGNE